MGIIMDIDQSMMYEAIKEAKVACITEEVPVGAVIVKNGIIISKGHNARETEQNALLHAEISAISNACKYLGSWRLSGCTMYVTLEPCPMCAGAIINSRIERVVFGAKDPKAGACCSVINIFGFGFNHTPALCAGVLESECSALLEEFFKNLRATKNKCR